MLKRNSKKNSRRSSKNSRGIKTPQQGDTLVKSFTLPGSGAVTSNGAGIIAVVTSLTAASVQSFPATEWASFAARYQQYRVRMVKLILDPCFPAAMSEPTTGLKNLPHTTLTHADFIGSAVPSSYAQLLADERSLTKSTSDRIVYTTDWSRNPNAKLWNPTSAALPTANSFGVAYGSNPGVTLPFTQQIFVPTFEWVVEFRGSQ